MCSVFHYFVYVFHLIKFVSFCCYRIFLVNKRIHYVQWLKWLEVGEHYIQVWAPVRGRVPFPSIITI